MPDILYKKILKERRNTTGRINIRSVGNLDLHPKKMRGKGTGMNENEIKVISYFKCAERLPADNIHGTYKSKSMWKTIAQGIGGKN